jgi:hypothetical protein
MVERARTAVERRTRGRVDMTDSFESRDDGPSATATQRGVITTLRE